METENISARVDKDVYEVLMRRVQMNGTKISHYINYLLRKELMNDPTLLLLQEHNRLVEEISLIDKKLQAMGKQIEYIPTQRELRGYEQ